MNENVIKLNEEENLFLNIARTYMAFIPKTESGSINRVRVINSFYECILENVNLLIQKKSTWLGFLKTVRMKTEEHIDSLKNREEESYRIHRLEVNLCMQNLKNTIDFLDECKINEM